MHGGKIFVCDTVQNLVEVFDLNKHRASYFTPQGEGRLQMPINIAIDADGTRYVADSYRRQVVIYGDDGTYLGAIGKKDEMKPTDVAVSSNRLYVADMQNHNVRVYGKADHQLLFTVPNGSNTNEGQLFSPANLALDNKGRLLVSDVGGADVQIYDLDGKYLRTIGQPAWGRGLLPGPRAWRWITTAWRMWWMPPHKWCKSSMPRAGCCCISASRAPARAASWCCRHP